MSNTMTGQAVLVSATKLNPNMGVQQFALFYEDGTPFDPETAVPNASTTVKGVVNQMPAQADTAASDVAGLVTAHNALLAKLRTAGLLAV